MQPFELPDFYMPWPARVNPNLDAARTHSKVWAREMGILDTPKADNTPAIWDENDFDKHDYALFCSYIHPEASSPELNLMTDWNVWGFYVDDYFVQVFMQSNEKNYVGAKKYLDQMLLFMPVNLNSIPIPNNPTERGLADVWLRTASTKSEAWRCRIIESTRSLFEACIWELENMSQQRLANPIEYIAVRRQVGGALWSADLVEHVMSIEIPERIAYTRPMQVLKDTFADGVHLRNDIFSYEREVIKEKQVTNAVLVFERFLDVDTQRAANLVNDLITSRVHRFEHIVLTELAAIFQEYALDPMEQASVFTYIRGLQDFQAGAHEWHIQTGRYMNPSNAKQTSNLGDSFLSSLPGLGTASMRITPATLQLSMNRFKNYNHTPYKNVGPTHLPQFYMPFTAQTNPNLEIVRHHSRAWAHKVGLLDVLPGHPEVFIWDKHRFDATDLALLCAIAYPNMAAAELNLTACWMIWATYTDDYFARLYWRTNDIAGAKIAHARLSEFMPIESSSAPAATPLTPVERGLADLWACATKSLSINDRRSFRKSIEGLIGSWIWELADQMQNRIPDPVDYIELRRKTFGVEFILVFIRFGKGQAIPADVYRTCTMQELSKAAGDYIWMINDIMSYQKEIEFDGEMHNGVLVIENFLNCDRKQAVETVNKLMTARIEQFEYIVKTELPILFENFNLDKKAREQLLLYVEELQRYMCSALLWHVKTGRYDENEFRRSPKFFTGNATGLGTAAAHILAIVAQKDVDHSAAMPDLSTALLTEESVNPVKTFAVSHLASPFIKKKEEA